MIDLGLRVRTVFHKTVGSAMFTATVNLITRVGTLKDRSILIKFSIRQKFSCSDVFQNVKKKILFVKKLKSLCNSDHPIMFKVC